MCSCMRVTPIASTGIGPSTVRTVPEWTPVVGLAMRVSPFFSQPAAPSGTGGS